MIRIDTDLLKLLPEFYREVLDYQEIMETEKTELEILSGFINAVHDNLFVQTLDEASIEVWERLLGISSVAGQTLAFRRVRILNRISIRPPFTLSFLYTKLDELIGAGNWTARMDYANYTLYVESSAMNQSYATEVTYTINSIKPAHIVFINSPYLTHAIAENEAIYLDKQIFNYALGDWGLGLLPFASIEEEIAKMASVPSVQDELLNDIAGYINTDVASARINGSVTISTLTKTVEDNVVTIVYEILPSQVTTVTKIELLDSAGHVLTDSAVYIPITTATEIKHKLETIEGVN